MCSLCFVKRFLHNCRDVFPRMPSAADQHPQCVSVHDDAIKWKHFPRYWTFVRGIQRSPVNSAHKGQWRETLMFSLIFAWTNGWVNNRYAGDLSRHYGHRRHCKGINVCSPHCDITVVCGRDTVHIHHLNIVFTLYLNLERYRLFAESRCLFKNNLSNACRTFVSWLPSWCRHQIKTSSA